MIHVDFKLYSVLFKQTWYYTIGTIGPEMDFTELNFRRRLNILKITLKFDFT